jgi:hypothetical protein
MFVNIVARVGMPPGTPTFTPGCQLYTRSAGINSAETLITPAEAKDRRTAKTFDNLMPDKYIANREPNIPSIRPAKRKIAIKLSD